MKRASRQCRAGARLLVVGLAFILSHAGCATGKSIEKTVTQEYDGGDTKLKYDYIERDGERLRHGDYERWHANGQKHVEGTYRHDRPDGRWRFWLPNGDQYAQTRYDAERNERTDVDVILSIFEVMETLGPVRFCERDELRAVVDDHQDDIDACFERAGDDQVSEEITYAWTVELSGEVFDAKVADDQDETDDELTGCHREVIEQMRWEPPVGGECKIKFKFQCESCD